MTRLNFKYHRPRRFIRIFVEKIAGIYAIGSLLGTARAARAEPAESRSSGGGGSHPLHRGEERRRSKKESDVEKNSRRRRIVASDPCASSAAGSSEVWELLTSEPPDDLCRNLQPHICLYSA
ncbi:hypothetical protein ACS0PU_009135 [Formica fusca]